MTDNEKYYTPKIEDLFIGYECQYKLDYPPHNKIEWNDYVFNSFANPINQWMEDDEKRDLTNLIRTKYLDAEDILNEKNGFIHDCSFSEGFSVVKLIGGDVFHKIYVNVLTHTIEIKQQDRTVFLGYCPSINELKKIMQLCQIPH